MFSEFVTYWEIRKVVNGHSFILIWQMAALQMCLGGDIQYPSASSFVCFRFQYRSRSERCFNVLMILMILYNVLGYLFE